MRNGACEKVGSQMGKKKDNNKEKPEYFFAPLPRMIFFDIWNVSLNYSCMAGDSQEDCWCNSSLSKC